VLALVLALLSAACGSSSKKAGDATTGGSSGSGSKASCSSPGVSADAIKVGAVFPQTGPVAALAGQFGFGVDAAFKVENAKGGVNGRKLELSQGNADTAPNSLTAAQSLVENESVFGLINGAATAAPMYPYLKQKAIPLVTNTGSDPATATDANVFSATGVYSDAYVNTAAPELLKEHGATNVAILALNSPVSASTAKATQGAITQLGMKVGYTNFNVPATSYDATPDALSMKEKGIDAVVSFTPGQPSLSIATAVRQQQLQMKIMELTQLYDEALLGNPATENIYTGVTTVPFLGDASLLPEGGRLIREAADKYTPGQKVTQYYAYGYASAVIFMKGLELAGDCPTREKFITELRKVTDYTANGTLAGPVSFVKTEISANGNPFACYWFVQNSGSSFKPNAKATCGTFVKS
jgi:ABC-type branched-subunit amino acid transport system substrate-binding protein